jgi:hypothetical protein
MWQFLAGNLIFGGKLSLPTFVRFLGCALCCSMALIIHLTIVSNPYLYLGVYVDTFSMHFVLCASSFSLYVILFGGILRFGGKYHNVTGLKFTRRKNNNVRVPTPT